MKILVIVLCNNFRELAFNYFPMFLWILSKNALAIEIKV